MCCTVNALSTRLFCKNDCISAAWHRHDQHVAPQVWLIKGHLSLIQDQPVFGISWTFKDLSVLKLQYVYVTIINVFFFTRLVKLSLCRGWYETGNL